MFFVEKAKIGTTLGAQKEYTAANRRGIGFHSAVANGHGVWHYLWPIESIEPSIRSRFENDEDTQGVSHVIWSQEVAVGETVGEPVISAFSGEEDWVREASQRFTAARTTATN